MVGNALDLERSGRVSLLLDVAEHRAKFPPGTGQNVEIKQNLDAIERDVELPIAQDVARLRGSRTFVAWTPPKEFDEADTTVWAFRAS